MADARITITIDADGTTAAQSIDLVTGALRNMGDVSEKHTSTVKELTEAFFFMKETVNATIEYMRQLYEATAGQVIEFADMVEKLNNTSQALGITAQQLHQMDDAAQLLGMSTETFNNVLMMMERNLGNTASAASPVTTALRALGIDLVDLRALGADDQFSLIALALGRVQDPAERAHMSMLLFGRGFRELTPLLKEGGEAFKEARERAGELGFTISAQLVQQSEDLLRQTRELDIAWRSLSVGWKELTMGPLTDLVAQLAKLVAHIKEIGSLKFALEAVAWLMNPIAAASIHGLNTAASGLPGFEALGNGGAPASGGGGAPGKDLSALLQAPTVTSDDQVWAYVRTYNLGRQIMVAQGIMGSVEQKALDIGGAQGGPTVNDNILSSLGLNDEKRAEQMRGYGVDMNRFAGMGSDATGLNLTPGMLGGAMSIFMDLLMKNPLFQADMKRVMDMVQQLITPLVEAIGPSLDALAPVMEELKPVFKVIGEYLRIYLSPLVLELHAVAWALKPVSDGLDSVAHFLDVLARDIENFDPTGMGGGGGGGGHGAFGINVSSSGNVSVDTNPSDWVPHAAGGVLGSRDFVVPPGVIHPTEGLTMAAMGESIGRKGSGGPSLTFNITALDPKTIAESIRRMLEEQHALGRLGVN